LLCSFIENVSNADGTSRSRAKSWQGSALGWKTPAEALDELLSSMKRKRTGVATTV
jgi:hypothetical protein